MLHFIFGRAGTGKTYECRKILDALATASADAVLIVPEQYSFESERALLHHLGAEKANKIEVLSFSRLCDRVFSLYGGSPMSRLDDAGKAVLLGQALLQIKGQLTLYGGQTANMKFIEALMNAISEFKQWGISSADLTKATEGLHEGLLKSKTTDMALLLGTYEALTEQSYADPQDDLTLLAQRLEQYNFFEDKTVVIDGFKGFTLQQLRVLEKIMTGARDVTITLCTDNLSEGQEDISLFSNIGRITEKLTTIAKSNFIKIASPDYLTKQYRFQSDELRHLEENLFDPGFTVFEGAPEHIQICTAGTIHDEVDFVARTIKGLVREKGLRYREIAVIARNIENYQGVIDTAFQRYHIPLFLDARRPIDSMTLFKFATGAFDIVNNHFDIDDIIPFLKTGLTDISEEDIARLENYTAMWGISGKLWHREWKSNPEGFVEGFSDQSKKELAEINAIKDRFGKLMDGFRRDLENSDAAGFATAVYHLIKNAGADKALHRLSSDLEASGEIKAAEDERRSFDLLMHILDSTVNALSEFSVSLKDYSEYLSLAISLADFGSVPQGLDEVSAGSAERMRPAEPRVVFIIGANEGVFPKDLSAKGLLTGADRAKLISLGVEIADNAQTEAVEENYLFYTSLCAASEGVYVSYVSSDTAGNQLSPSPVVTHLRSIFPGLELTTERVDYEGRNRLCQVEAEKPALALTARIWKRNIPLSSTLKQYFSQKKTDLYHGIKAAADNETKALTPENAKNLFGENINISATRIDVFHKCRFSYFCQYGLLARPFRTAELNVLERGSLIHFVLERFIKAYGGKGISLLPKEETAKQIRILLDEYMENVMGGKQDKSPRLLFLIERIAVLLESLLEHIGAELSQSFFEPAAFEMPIDEGEEGIRPVRMALPDGGTITVRGKIDRVDTYRSGNQIYVRIVDYKTGKKKLNLSDVLYGQNLQMLLYLFALKNGGEETLGGRIIPAGILYMPSKRMPSKVSRYAPAEELLLDLRKTLKMSGLILNDETVFSAMEKDGLGIFTPFKLKKDGTPDSRSSVADLAVFGSIERHINKLLVKMGQALHRGDIAVQPLDGVGDNACRYCDFRGACGRETT